ncbi:hypothetical protein D3C73_279000 [compost metagenome]
MRMYIYSETKNGWGIFFSDDFCKKGFISAGLSRKQAEKWCNRLNEAYRSGVGYGSY